jgi:twitching motility protein PilT
VEGGGAVNSELVRILRAMAERGASDLHLRPGEAYMRVAGRMMPVDGTPPDPEAVVETMPARIRKAYEEGGDVDWPISVDGVGFFRCHAYRNAGGHTFAIRRLPTRIPTIDELGLPAVLHKWAQAPMGLGLVCGITGSGKSTTLAAVLDEINRTRAVHILTIEDPIEYRFLPKRGLISQRQVGLHVSSFAEALRSAMREDPDVIMVGEMRDAESVEAALSLAASGHLLFTTLHVGTVADIPHRIIDLFPPQRQEGIRSQLAQVFLGAVVQRLIPRVGGEYETDPFKQRVAATEVLVGTNAVKQLIRSGETHKLLAQIELERQEGMWTMDESIADLVRRGLIGEQDAFLACNSQEALKRALSRQVGTVGPIVL